MTNNNPLFNYFKKTTLFPLNLPANNINTDPAFIDFLSLAVLVAFFKFLFLPNLFGSSSALYHFDILFRGFFSPYFPLGAILIIIFFDK